MLSAARRNFESIARLNGKVNACTHTVAREDLLKRAAEADGRWDEGTQFGPLDGATVAIKNNICTRGALPTTCGSKMLSDFTSPFNATVVDLLEKAGLLVIAKTNMDEFGMGSSNLHSAHGCVINPRAPDRVAGGSSGGSAAAVASGMARIALGSDTGGSVRLPAAYCGVIGFKPSYGRFSRWGLVSYASSLDTVGIFANTVNDAYAAYCILGKKDERDATSMELPWTKASMDASTDKLDESKDDDPPPTLLGRRIGMPKEYFVDGLSAESAAAWEMAIEALRSLGATIVNVSLPHTSLALPTYYVLAPAEASSNLARYDGLRYGAVEEKVSPGMAPFAAVRTMGFGDEVRRRLLLGTFVLSESAYGSYYAQAQKVRRLIQKDFNEVFKYPHPHSTYESFTRVSGVDAIITPATVGPAPTVAEYEDPESGPVNECVNDVMTVPASLAGLPAMSVPITRTGKLPLGVQLIAQYGNDGAVFEIADALLKALKNKDE
ncbi:Trimeric GatFAB AmidoTransferase(AdT) complex subunit [Irineochytrium annulatum]|nr:Trimeric GatFAB AmidoTransferase(AdT) complex subunit [Irineochytrium annulatum]